MKLSVAAMLSPMQWKPIKTAPQDGTPILLLFPEFSCPSRSQVVMGFWTLGGWCPANSLTGYGGLPPTTDEFTGGGSDSGDYWDRVLDTSFRE